MQRCDSELKQIMDIGMAESWWKNLYKVGGNECADCAIGSASRSRYQLIFREAQARRKERRP